MLRAKLRTLWRLVRQSIDGWVDDRASSLGAALAYYTAFSLAPLLLIVIGIAGLVFGREAAQGALIAQVGTLVGETGAQAVHAMLEGAQSEEGGIIATVVSAFTLFIGATTVFAELRRDLNQVWKAPEPQGNGLWNFLRTRVLSFGMVLGTGFLMIVSLVLSAAIAAIGTLWSGWFEGVEPLLHLLNFLVSFAVTTLLFAMIYKVLPNARIDWGDVWVGAAVTSLLFSVGRLLIGLYIGKSAISSSFGAAGAFVVLLVWIYYSTQIFLLGAEFTYVYAHEIGSRRHDAGRGATIDKAAT